MTRRTNMHIDDAREGLVVELDGGFTCVKKGVTTLHWDAAGGPYFNCDDGRHYLSGQVDASGCCVGILTTNLETGP